MKRFPRIADLLKPLRGDRDLIARLSAKVARDRAQAPGLAGADPRRPTPEQIAQTRNRMRAAARWVKPGRPIVIGVAYARQAFAEQITAQREAITKEKT